MKQDPVCGMQVDETRTTTTAVHGGETYYFCSKACQHTFEKAPEQYAKPGSQGR
jgi:Cu+-exporting ATPase